MLTVTTDASNPHRGDLKEREMQTFSFNIGVSVL